MFSHLHPGEEVVFVAPASTVWKLQTVLVTVAVVPARRHLGGARSNVEGQEAEVRLRAPQILLQVKYCKDWYSMRFRYCTADFSCGKRAV